MHYNLNHFHAPAGIPMAIISFVSEIGKLANVEETQKYMEEYGVPGMLLWPAAAFEIATGWCLLTAVIFHTEFKDQEQQINFTKNLVMAGGFLILAQKVVRAKSNGQSAEDPNNVLEKQPLRSGLQN